MEKKVNKFTKILLLIVMIFSDLMTPIKVLAEEKISVEPTKGDVGINNAVSSDGGNSVTVSAGAVRNEDGTLSNEGDVSVTKTVSKAKDENGNVIEGKYNVEFNIKGKDVVSSTNVTKPVYVVVVFDNSGSMQNYCIGNIFGSDKGMGTEENCGFLGSFYTLYPKWKNSVAGAKLFANTLLDSIPEAQIALVTFSSGTSENPAREFSNANLDNANFGEPDGGTNLHAGLKKANELLSDTDVVPENANKYVVVISDGQPTFYVNADGEDDSDGNGSGTSRNELVATLNEATSIKNNGIEVFAIGYDLPTDTVYDDTNNSNIAAGDKYGALTAEDILRRVASADTAEDIQKGITHYLVANPSAVATAFTNVATSISRFEAGTNATLTDNIGSNFKIVGQEGSAYTSTISKITETGTTISFQVELDSSSITSDGWYNTNDGFTLTYTDASGNEQTITCDEDPQVWLTPEVYEYTVNYYKDSFDTVAIKSDVREATNGTVINASNVDTGKYLNNSSLGTVGYEYNSINGVPVTISSNGKVINILYTIKKFDYTVEFYYDGVIDDSMTVTETNVNYGTEIDASTYYDDGDREGYSLDTANSTSGTVVIDSNDEVIRVYYKKNSYGYTVNYYFNNVIDTDFTKPYSAVYGSTIKAEDNYLSDSNLTSKENKDSKDYFIDPSNSNNTSNITIGTGNNELNIYYISTSVTEENMEKTSNTDKITSGDTPVTYTVKYTSVVSNVQKGDTVKVVITDTLPLEIDESKSNLNGGVYDASSKTITWTFETTMEEFTKEYDASRTITYTVVYENVGNGDGSTLTNSVVGNTTAGGKTTTDKGGSSDVEVKIPGKVTAIYVEDGNEENVLAHEEVTEGLVGEKYTTSAKDILGYTLKGEPSNKNGVYTEDDITVKYVYTKNDGEITNPEVSKEGPSKVDSVNSEFEYTITASGEIKDYVGEATLTVVDTLPYKATITLQDDRCTYDGNKTITCVQEYTIRENDYIENSEGEMVFAISETFNLKLVYTGIDSANVVNSAKSTITLVDSNKENGGSDSETTEVEKGSVTAIYVDENDTEIADKDTSTGLVGNTYTTSAKDIFGYTIKTKPDNETIEYTKEGTTVKYIYSKNDGIIDEDKTDIVKTSTNEDKTVSSINDTFKYEITAKGEVREYVGNVTVKVVDTLPYAIDEDNSVLDSGCTYNSTDKTITCVRVKTIDEDDYTDGVYVVDETFTLELKFVNVDSETVTNNAKVEISLDSNVKDEDTDVEDVTVKTGEVIVTYRDTNGEILSIDVTLSGLAGASYETEEKVFYGYTLIVDPDNKSGVYLANQTIPVDYVYSKNDGSVTNNGVQKKGPNSIENVEDTFDYTIEYSASITGYSGDVELKVVDTLPFSAVIVSMDDRCTYDGNKTITCIEKHNVSSDTEINEKFNISIKYTNIKFDDISTKTVLTNNVAAELIYGGKKVTNTGSKDTEVYRGNVLVTYRDTNGEILSDDVTLSGLAGEEYTTEEKSFFGYTLTGDPDNKEGEYLANQTIPVDYVYSKNDGIIDEDKTDIVKTSTNEDKTVSSINDTFKYSITARGEVREYVGDVTVKVVDTLPYELTEESISKLSSECTYNSTDKTITCVRVKTIDEDDYTDGVYVVDETFTLELEFVDVDSKTVTNNAKVEISLDSNVKDEDTDDEDVTVETGKVVVTYRDTLGNVLSDDVNLPEEPVGTEYTTEEKEFYGYTLTSEPENKEGVYTKEDIVVEYVYSKNVGTSEEELVKIGTEQVEDIDSAFDYVIRYNTIIQDYVGEATLVITDELPYEIDDEYSIYDRDACEYTDGKLVCTYSKNITEEDNTFDIEEEFTLYYIGIDSNKVTNKVNSVLTYGDTTKENDSEYTSEVKMGTVIVNYVTTDGTKLTESITLTGLVGDSYTTDKKEFDKYNFVEVRGEANGEYTEDVIEVTYVYDLVVMPPQTGVDMNMIILIKYLVYAMVVVLSGKTYKLIKNN